MDFFVKKVEVKIYYMNQSERILSYRTSFVEPSRAPRGGLKIHVGCALEQWCYDMRILASWELLYLQYRGHIRHVNTATISGVQPEHNVLGSVSVAIAPCDPLLHAPVIIS
jgi:hypothetical protein